MLHPFRVLALAAAALCAASTARADMIGFSYSWQALPSTVIPGGSGSVLLAPADGAQTSAELGGAATFIPGAEVRTTSSATSPPDTFNTPFHMKLTLTDTLSGASDFLVFDGTISGTLTTTTSTLTSTFDNPATKFLPLGGRVYSVTISPLLVSLPSPGPNAALIDARVQVSNAPSNPGPPTQETPEPATLLLAGLAAAGLAARRAWGRVDSRVARR